MITLEFRRRYWTLLVNGRAILTHASRDYLLAVVPEAVVVS